MPEVETVTAPTLPDTDRALDEGGDHDRFAHYVRKDRILPSAIEGSPVVALCGKKWVPARDPERFPVCPACKEIYEQMKGG
jgi:hypothetical protein